VIGDFNRQIAQTGQPIGVFLGTGFMRCGVSNNADTVVVDGAGTKGVLGTFCGSAASGALFIGPDGFPVQDPDLRIVQTRTTTGPRGAELRSASAKLQIAGLVDNPPRRARSGRHQGRAVELRHPPGHRKRVRPAPRRATPPRARAM